MDERAPIRLRVIFGVGTLFGLVAAAASTWFTWKFGRSLWSLQHDPSTAWWYVNLERVRELVPRPNGDCTVSLVDGTKLVMSRGYRAALQDHFGRSF
jgi:hypothetical protein